METIVVVLMILVCFNFMMKQTFRKRGSVAAIAVVAALFVGLGFFVFFGNDNSGSFQTAVCPKPYQKRRITKVTTVKVP